MNLKISFCYSASAAALTCFLFHAPSALADYPGEIWSVDSLSITSVGQTAGNFSKSKLRMSLQRANDVYFFGEQSVRMKAEISSGNAPMLRLTLIKLSDGALIARSPMLAMDVDGASIEASALAWMEGLTCAQTGCATEPELEQPVRVAKAHRDVVVPTSDVNLLATKATEQAMAGIPVPVTRPRRDGASVKRGKESIGGSGLAGKDLGFSAVPFQIAVSFPREVGALTYGDADQLTLDHSIQLARVSTVAPIEATPVRSAQSVPKPRIPEVTPKNVPKTTPEQTLFGLLLTRVAGFLGINSNSNGDVLPGSSEQTAVRSVVQTSAERATAVPRTELLIPKTSLAADVPVPEATKSPEPSTWQRASEPVSLINPIERRLRAEPELSVAPGEKIAIADLKPRTADPANVQLRVGGVDALSNRELLRSIRRDPLATGKVIGPPRVTKTNLSVRLHPDLFGRYGTSNVTANVPSGKQRVASASRTISGAALGDSSKLNTVLSERGMEIDLAGYNRFDRLYWSGREAEGFWISMPNRVGSKFVLVSGPNASVIASVRRRAGIARTSAGVAEALGLRPREWAKLRIIGLRSVNRSAGVVPLDWFSVRKGRNRIQ